MSNVTKVDFGKKTPNDIFTKQLTKQVTDESTLQFNHYMKILKEYNIGLSSSLIIVLHTVDICGRHITELTELASNKGAKVIVCTKPNIRSIDYKTNLYTLNGYIDQANGAAFYIISEVALTSEAAGTHIKLTYALDDIKGPAKLHICDEAILAIELFHNTLNETR